MHGCLLGVLAHVGIVVLYAVYCAGCLVDCGVGVARWSDVG